MKGLWIVPEHDGTCGFSVEPAYRGNNLRKQLSVSFKLVYRERPSSLILETAKNHSLQLLNIFLASN